MRKSFFFDGGNHVLIIRLIDVYSQEQDGL
jgi:hypothetical protein